MTDAIAVTTSITDGNPPQVAADTDSVGPVSHASGPSSFVAAAAAAEVKTEEDGDVEDPSSLRVRGDDDRPPPPSSLSVEKPLSDATTSSLVAPNNVGIFAGDEDDTASVFSFDSYEKSDIPLRVQDMIRRQREEQQRGDGDDPLGRSAVPFPSVVGASMEYERAVNVCPCRCLFFTLKETLCLILSALGCAVFVTGLVLLCMFLEGSHFNNSGE
ncbi:hypothetical protein ACHAWF_003618 [Thalassiosira exigua]